MDRLYRLMSTVDAVVLLGSPTLSKLYGLRPASSMEVAASDSAQIDPEQRLFVRGDGIGLNWTQGIAMTHVAQNTWQVALPYSSSAFGKQCVPPRLYPALPLSFPLVVS